MIGVRITLVDYGLLIREMTVKHIYFTLNSFLHTGIIVTLTDITAGYWPIAHLLEQGQSFTSLQFKSNFFRAIEADKLQCECLAEYLYELPKSAE